MASKLEQLRKMTVVVADTGDIDAIKKFSPQDCTTNPTLILKGAENPAYQHLVDEAVLWAISHHGDATRATHRVAVNFGVALANIVPGRVSTEVDADLSFDCEGMVEAARGLIADYEARKIPREKILIKLATTYEGAQAAKILQKDKIDCNMTLLFSLSQAAIAAQAGAFLISPFVGRILDWRQKAETKLFAPAEDPGVLFVKTVYDYYKAHDIETIVMGASFRNLGEIEELAGCDRLTIAPQWLEYLAHDHSPLPRKLVPAPKNADAPALMDLDEKTFRWLLNEDQMATEKLSEGIRLFTNDLRALRAMMSKKILQAQ